MQESRQNLIVGLFAVCGLGVLAALIMMFGGVLDFAARNYDVRIVFPHGTATNLREGSSVTLNGKRVGTTTSVDFRDPAKPHEGIVVGAAIEGRYRLPQGCRAEVQTSIMGFGRPALQLVIDDVPATAGFLPTDGSGELLGGMVPPMDQLIRPDQQERLLAATQQIGQLAQALTPVAEDLHRLMEIRTMSQVDGDATQRITANLYTAVQRLDQTLKSFNAVLANPDNQANMTASIANLRKMSDDAAVAMKDFRSFAENAREFSSQGRQTLTKLDDAVGTARETFETAGRKFVQVSDDTSRLMSNLDKSALQLAEGNGTAGLLLRDNRLYESMVLTSERLAQAINDLRDVLALAKKGELRLRVF